MNQRKKSRSTIPPRRRSRDPHHAREAGRYERPVASREFILETLKQRGVPVEERELERLLDIVPQDSDAFASRIGAKSTRVYVTGENLWTWSPLYKYADNIDVENATAPSDRQFVGNPNGINPSGAFSDNSGDAYNYPMLRSYNIGATVTF